MIAKSRGLKRPRLFADETPDDLLHGELKLIQRRKGYRYSVDALLLADFVLPGIKSGHKIMDLGAGSGVISLILAQRARPAEVVAVEIQKSLAVMARRNVALNRLEGRVKILNLDARKLRQKFPAQSFDLIVSNPPFRKVGTGLLSPNRERALARYELKLTMPELISICDHRLKPKGRLALIYPFERLQELVAALEKTSLRPGRLKFAFHKKGDPVPILFCLEAVKTRQALKLEPPWFIESPKGRFSIDRDR